MAMLKTLARLDKLIWTLIFGGLLGFVLGLSLQRHGEALAGVFIGGGLLLAALGGLLIYIRSLLNEPEEGPPTHRGSRKKT